MSPSPQTPTATPADAPAAAPTATPVAPPAPLAPAAATPVAPAADAPATEVDDAADDAPKRRRGRPKGSTARTTRTVELTLTVAGTADGEWQAELKQGSTWLSRGLPVTAAAVAKAALELHPELAAPIEEMIDSAREQRAARVAALEAELEQAKKALAEMD